MKTITYDETMWRLVPIEMDDKMQAAAMKVLDDSIGNYASSRARDCYAAMLAAAPQPESAAPEQDDWKSKAAAWLRAKADAQEKNNIAYPEHAKCYPSWVKRVRDLRWDAEELDGVMGSYGAPADEDLSEDDADSDSILAEIAGTTNRTATWKQFSEYLQRLARSAISCKQSPAPKAQSLDRVIELENELIELINHCSVIEEPGSVIDSAYKTLVKDKLTLRNPEPGSFNAIAEGGK